jgi:hypothetical protein
MSFRFPQQQQSTLFYILIEEGIHGAVNELEQRPLFSGSELVLNVVGAKP